MNRLSLQRINEKSPYKVVESLKGDYLFSTDKGVNYTISFNEEFELGGCMAYQFSIINSNRAHAAHDEKIKDTILAIIDDFFFQNQNILLYICDTSDGREAARNRLFISWFQQSSQSEHYLIKTAHAQVEGEMFYAAIIVDKNNLLISAIEEDFNKQAKLLSK